LKILIEQKLGMDFYSSKHQILILRGQNITTLEKSIYQLEMKDTESIIVIGYKWREPVAQPKKKPSEVSADTKIESANGKSAAQPGSQVTFNPDPKVYNQLLEYGFDKKSIQKALQQTDDIEVATELILSGLKSDGGDGQPIASEVDMGPGEKSENYAKIKEVLESFDIPSLVKQSRETNQSVLEALCNELLTNNPEGMKLLLQDTETFNKVYMDLLEEMNIAEDEEIELGGDDKDLFDTYGKYMDMDGDQMMQVDQTDSALIDSQLTEEDEKNITTLTELGFSTEQSKVAYLACNKDVDRAAVLLYEDKDDA